METEVVVILQGTGVVLAQKGVYEHIFAAGFDPLKKLVDNFIELGGQIWVCTPCINERKITTDMLVGNTKPVTAGAVVNATMEAAATLCY